MNNQSQLLQAIQYKGGISCIYGTCYDETNWSQLVANYILTNLIKHNRSGYNNQNNINDGHVGVGNSRGGMKRFTKNDSNDVDNAYRSNCREIVLLNFDSHHLTGQYLEKLMNLIDTTSDKAKSTNINMNNIRSNFSNSCKNGDQAKKTIESYNNITTFHHNNNLVHILDYTNHSNGLCTIKTQFNTFDITTATPLLDHTSILYDIKTLLQNHHNLSTQPSIDNRTIRSSCFPTIFIYSLSELIINYGLRQTKGGCIFSDISKYIIVLSIYP